MHAPFPSQLPLCWQVVLASTTHSLSGSVLAATGPHLPSAPEDFLPALQAWQSPVQGESQQNPSAQLPLAHCEAAVQIAPTA